MELESDLRVSFQASSSSRQVHEARQRSICCSKPPRGRTFEWFRPQPCRLTPQSSRTALGVTHSSVPWKCNMGCPASSRRLTWQDHDPRDGSAVSTAVVEILQTIIINCLALLPCSLSTITTCFSKRGLALDTLQAPC